MQSKNKVLKRLISSSAILVTALGTVSTIQPAFANQNVEVQEQAGENLSFDGRTDTDKIVNPTAGSNTPDADGYYNSQIKDITVLSKNENDNSVRYRITFKDGFSIPKGGQIRFLMSSANQYAPAKDLYMGKTNVATISTAKTTDTSKEFVDDLKSENTLAGYRSKLDKATSVDVFGTTEWKMTFNEEFEKLNKDRYVEFVASNYIGPIENKKLPILYIDGQEKAKLFADDTIYKKIWK